MKKVGLTLGKFAPFHLGHQHVVDTALGETDELIVVIYDAKDVTPIPLKTRANWIRKLYPQVIVIEGEDGPTDAGHAPEIKRIQEQYILGLLKGKRVTHFYCSEFYGEHMSNALGAENRLVDLERVQFPVSGTGVRNDLFSNRRFLHPEVYKDLISNVVFVGAPSTGKTTIAEASARRFNTSWMPEYGREYWEKHNIDRRLTADQLVELAEGHLKREDRKLLEANQYLFTDTNAITTYMFSQYYHGYAKERLTRLASAAENRYHLFFVCDTDILYDDTWDRSGDANRMELQQQIIADLERRRIPFTLLSGNIEERIRSVEQTLKNFKRLYHE